MKKVDLNRRITWTDVVVLGSGAALGIALGLAIGAGLWR